MNERTLEALEYQKIRNLLVAVAVTPMGKQSCATLLPSSDHAEVLRRQRQTAELRRMLDARLELPLGAIRDIRSAIWWAASDAQLSAQHLLELGQTLAAAREIKQMLLAQREAAPLLASCAEQLGEFPELEAELHRVLEPDGVVRDDATPELGRLRAELRSLQAEVLEQLRASLADPAVSPLLEAHRVDLWNGRRVLPVKAAHQATFPGVVHRPASPGAAALIEPLAAVELNNAIARLVDAETEAVGQVLRAVSQVVGAQFSRLRQTIETLGEIDFIAARAALGYAMRANTPAMNHEGRLLIRRGRHPLLTGRVVPLEIHLGQSFDVLVVTGPNTGGKTVTLKTVGLFCLMAQAGLQVPAAEGTELPVFDQIFCDIGDEQSIEQNLSTFSGHIVNIADILERVQGNSLVLLDELGAGTDPAEGAALAMAVLDYLLNRGAKVIATTHFGDLKQFATTRSRVENASVEFNPESLRSTFRLLIGVPGTSQALAVATRLGLSEVVVDQARRFLADR